MAVMVQKQHIRVFFIVIQILCVLKSSLTVANKEEMEWKERCWDELNKVEMRTKVIIAVAIVSIVVIQATAIKTSRSEERQLGELLFLHPILSKDSAVSCSSCHLRDCAFADTSVVSLAVGKRKGTRNSPAA